MKRNIDFSGKRILPTGRILVRAGLVGSKDEIIVDNPDNPTNIVGVCDGKGNVIPTSLSLSKFDVDSILGIG